MPYLEMLEVLKLFPKVFSTKMNEALEIEVSEAELEATLFSMKKGKIPSLNDFSVEFYIGFFDLLKEDLLKVV
jgi:hypothetical protein